MSKWAVLALALLPLAPVRADRAGQPAASSKHPPIIIAINPEERLSVSLGGTLPPPVACGRPAVLAVRIVNQGAVTPRLQARLAADIPAGATLEFHPAPLTGAAEELRELYITLTRPGLTDITIAFRAQGEAADLGGRDRIHLLMRCPRVD